jgi:hypothetical protein
MKYKKGDTVKIKSLDDLIKSGGEIFNNYSFTKQYIESPTGSILTFDLTDMHQFCNQIVKIHRVYEDCYEIIIEEKGEKLVDYNMWEDWMFDGRREKVIEILTND